ncbi:hypothetical protein [Hyphomicrobium sp. NDB2Meth4]|uniref:hypothetical protein n=1 Tax=Hyphomicrobium sp. NDB2Meth4 TaxID=1892846 RepID=UPI000931552B|nr:hypothetical protein [Hyphomicrobium sp. NDB2Meth4]
MKMHQWCRAAVDVLVGNGEFARIEGEVLRGVGLFGLREEGRNETYLVHRATGLVIATFSKRREARLAGEVVLELMDREDVCYSLLSERLRQAGFYESDDGNNVWQFPVRLH